MRRQWQGIHGAWRWEVATAGVQKQLGQRRCVNSRWTEGLIPRGIKAGWKYPVAGQAMPSRNPGKGGDGAYRSKGKCLSEAAARLRGRGRSSAEVRSPRFP